MEKIIPAFSESLFEPTLGLGINMAELGIDSVLDEGLMRSIPIAKTLIGVVKTGQNIYERHLLKKTLQFIETFNAHTIDEEKLKKYREKLSTNSAMEEEELGRVLIILNKVVDNKKSIILALLFRAYVNEEINWDMFCELTDITDRLFISDLSLLQDIFAGKINDTKHCNSYQAERLISLGLLDFGTQSEFVLGGKHKSSKFLSFNSLGKTFCRIILHMMR